MNIDDVENKQVQAFIVPVPDEMIDQQNKLVDWQVEVFVRYCLAKLKVQKAKGNIIGEVSFYNKQPEVVAKAIEMFVARGWRVWAHKRLFRRKSSLVFAKSLCGLPPF